MSERQERVADHAMGVELELIEAVRRAAEATTKSERKTFEADVERLQDELAATADQLATPRR